MQAIFHLHVTVFCVRHTHVSMLQEAPRFSEYSNACPHATTVCSPFPPPLPLLLQFSPHTFSFNSIFSSHLFPCLPSPFSPLFPLFPTLSPLFSPSSPLDHLLYPNFSLHFPLFPILFPLFHLTFPLFPLFLIFFIPTFSSFSPILSTLSFLPCVLFSFSRYSFLPSIIFFLILFFPPSPLLTTAFPLIFSFILFVPTTLLVSSPLLLFLSFFLFT